MLSQFRKCGQDQGRGMALAPAVDQSWTPPRDPSRGGFFVTIYQGGELVLSSWGVLVLPA